MTVLMTTILLGILGLFFGSFAGAMVWRLRSKQLEEDKRAKEKVSKNDTDEVRHVKPLSVADDRSICLHCGHKLAWYDLIPLISWLQLKGKCRYCHKKIGWLEPVVELSVGVFFAASYFFWPQQLDTTWALVQFVCWLIAGVGLAILFIYDSKWFLLPDRVMFILLAVASAFSFATLIEQNFAISQIVNILIAAAILSGIYYIIYVASKHQWVGFGDVKLGLVLALLLADWRLAALALFLANLIGTIILMPMMLNGRIKRHAHIPFGPFLIAGWFFAGLFGQQIIAWYILFTLGAS